MRMNWFRVYHEARNDAKLRTLSDSQFRVWFNLLCLASEQDERGILDEFPVDLLSIEVAGGDDELLDASLRILAKLRIIRMSRPESVTGVTGVTIEFIHFDSRQYDKPSDKPEATAERKRHQRERDRARRESEQNERDHTPASQDVTPSHALSHPEESREDKSREEVKREAQAPTRAARKPLTSHPLPPDFAISPGMRQWAKEKHVSDWIDIDKHTGRFVSYWTEGEGAGKCKKNWLLAWQNWMTAEAERAESRGVRRNNGNGPIPFVGSEWPPEGYSFEKDAEGQYIHLTGTLDGRLPYGARSDAEVQELHKVRLRDEMKRRNQRGAS